MMKSQNIDEWLSNATEDIISNIKENMNNLSQAIDYIECKMSCIDIEEKTKSEGGSQEDISYAKEAKKAKEEELKSTIKKYFED